MRRADVFRTRARIRFFARFFTAIFAAVLAFFFVGNKILRAEELSQGIMDRLMAVYEMLEVVDERHSGIVKRIVTDDWLIGGVDVRKVFNENDLSIGRGIFIDGISLRMLMESDEGILFMEIPEILIAGYLTHPAHGVLFLSDGSNWYVSDSQRLIHTWEPGRVIIDDGKIFFTATVADAGGLLVKAGIALSVTAAVSYLLLGLTIGFVLHLFGKTFDSASGRYEEILGAVETLASGSDLQAHPEELDSLLGTIRNLRRELSDSRDTSSRLLMQVEETNSKVLLINDMHHSAMLDMLRILFEATEWRNHRAIRKTGQMLEVTRLVTQELGISDPLDLRVIQMGLLLHDIGLMNVPENILHKPGMIDSSEEDIMMKHTLIGEKRALSMTESPLISDIVRHHHEKEDGTGYPDRLRGEEISVRVKIVAIVDEYFSLTEPRPWRLAFSHEDALGMIEEQVDSRYNKQVFAAFEKTIKAYIT